MRSLWKGTVTSFFKDISLSKLKTDKAFFFNRSTPITPYLAHSGHTVYISNGRSFSPLAIKGVGITEKYGSFVFTKVTGMKIHTSKKKNSKK